MSVTIVSSSLIVFTLVTQRGANFHTPLRDLTFALHFRWDPSLGLKVRTPGEGVATTALGLYGSLIGKVTWCGQLSPFWKGILRSGKFLCKRQRTTEFVVLVVRDFPEGL